MITVFKNFKTFLNSKYFHLVESLSRSYGPQEKQIPNEKDKIVLWEMETQAIKWTEGLLEEELNQQKQRGSWESQEMKARAVKQKNE